ncbi:MAG: ATP-binding protein [Pseudomonadota bacterium]
MRRAPFSLQTRLTVLLLGSMLLIGGIAGYQSHDKALHEADELFDAQLAQFADTLLSVATDLDDDQAAPTLPPAHRYQQSFVFEVWGGDEDDHGASHVLLRSDADQSLPRHDVRDRHFTTLAWDDGEWRFYRLRDHQRKLDVMVGQNAKVRRELAREVAAHNFSPLLFSLPLLALLSLLAIRYGLAPLRRLTASLQRLTPERLDTIDLGATPAEISPVVHAMNTLLTRTAGVIDNERRFTADAAHELRTPLAALQSQLQAARLTDDAAEREVCLQKSLQGAERMSHLVGQLLTLSRLDEMRAPALMETLDLAELARRSCADIAPQALDARITLALSAEAAQPVRASEELLHILLRNLLDNAIRYTPADGEVTVEVTAQALTVRDSGPGVEPEQLHRLGQRFDRLDRTAQEGVGLGLSIVQRIAALHGAQVTFRNAAPGGLEVRVQFPSVVG